MAKDIDGASGRVPAQETSGADGAAEGAGGGAGEALSRRPVCAMARQEAALSVGSLEAALLKEFPAADAESWDRTGLLVGERVLPVTRVAVALDPTVAAVRAAAERGANVLLTHHPAFLQPPDSFAPEPSPALSSGAVVWAAIQHRVTLMNFHTALDVSPRVARVLPGMLGLAFTGRFAEPLATTEAQGYGQICRVSPDEHGIDTLAQLAARCTAVFGRPPRVWGDLEAPVRTVATATGSAGTLGRLCLAQDVDCLICGEIKYHEALDVSGAGLAVIELGHDVSELPLVAVLAEALLRVGLPEERVAVIDQSGNWAYPEALRV